jgi:hypothetical protein
LRIVPLLFQFTGMTNQPPAVPIEDLRHFLKIRLAVAPRYWFERLWRPKGIAFDRDKTRDELVDFITQGWERYEVSIAEQPEPDERQGNLL